MKVKQEVLVNRDSRRDHLRHACENGDLCRRKFRV